tara:strand:- start:1700 stop:2206 length:507 start_codon:yes stop_codon:yes gene_type:complete
MNQTLSTERDTPSETKSSYIPDMGNLQKVVEEMRRLAQHLVPYTFPKVEFQEEQEILPLKQRRVTVDGYDVVICFSEADYGEYTLLSLQVQSAQSPFLPFTLICKVGQVFLGVKHLSYIEFFRNNKKVYCWTIKTKEGRLLRPGKMTKAGSYEGFDFRILHPGSVDLF